MKIMSVVVMLLVTSACRAEQQKKHYGSLSTYSKDGHVQVVVEISAGTNKKLEYDYATNTFPADTQNGNERIIDFLPYPGNYGFIPSTMMDRARGGDGDSIDVLLMSEHLKAGTVIEVIPIALLNLIDRGEIDSKIIAVPVEPNLRIVKATSLSQLRASYPSIQKLIELWFLSYKGPNTIESRGWEDEKVAKSEIARWVTSE
jgi:inorganic pyrophosphatase